MSTTTGNTRVQQAATAIADQLTAPRRGVTRRPALRGPGSPERRHLTGAPHGDAARPLGGGGALQAAGFAPPVLPANVPCGDLHTTALESRYAGTSRCPA